MGRKSKKRAKTARRKKTLLPPPVAAAGGAVANAPPLAVLAAEVPQQVPVAPPLELRDEHRKSERISLSVELHLASESHFFSGLSGDISEGGVFVSTYRDLATGTPVDLEFSLPGSNRVVKAKGEVKWHRSASEGAPPGVGIAFEELSEDDRRLIHRFCSIRPPLYYDDVG